jgi:hypothetical protein
MLDLAILACCVLAGLIAFGSRSGVRPPPDQWPYFGSEQHARSWQRQW